MGAMFSDAAAQATDEGLVLLAVKAQGVVVLAAGLWRALAWTVDVPQGINYTRQGHVRWRTVSVYRAAAHRTLELAQSVHVHRSDTTAAIRVTALQHEGLRENLQTNRATELLL